MHQEEKENNVPILRKWSNWYLLLIAFLILEILIFTVITKMY